MNILCKFQQLFLIAGGSACHITVEYKKVVLIKLGAAAFTDSHPQIISVSVSSSMPPSPTRYCSTSASRLSHYRQLEADVEPLEQSKTGAREPQGETLLWCLPPVSSVSSFQGLPGTQSSATVGARLFSLCPQRQGH